MSRFVSDIGDLNRLLRCQRAPERRVGAGSDHGVASPFLGIGWRNSVERNRTKAVSLRSIHCAKFGLADARRVRQHGLEYRLQLTGRRTDDLEHLGRCGLLLQCLGEIVGTMPQFVEQSRVLDGYDGLSSEGLH